MTTETNTIQCPRCKVLVGVYDDNGVIKFCDHSTDGVICSASYRNPDIVLKELDDPILHFGPLKVSRAIRWQNDMVMVFNVDGEQVEELQGRYSDHLVAAILIASGPLTKFQWAVWLTGETTEVDRAEW